MITILDIAPPTLRLPNVDTPLVVSADELRNYRRLRRAALDRATVILPHLTQPEWDRILVAELERHNSTWCTVKQIERTQNELD